MDTVFFILAKLVGALLKVETWLALLAAVTVWAVWTARVRAAKRASALLLAMLLVIGAFPLGDRLLRPIEASVTGSPASDLPVDGIIVLGGGEDLRASIAARQPQLDEAADRYLATLLLARRYPEARIIFAGGSGRLRDLAGADVSEASIAEQIFLAQGVAPARLLFESRSRNTVENARLALDLVQPEPGQRWVLVTSAFHMPRATRSFEAAGWSGLVPYPVDYRTRSWADGLGWDLQRNLEMLNTGIREWVGRAAYAVAGR
ncbi:YdcF family protein [Roseicyclus sp.]